VLAILYGASFFVGLAGFLIAACIVGWQVLQWLQLGEWVPVSVVDALPFFGVEYPHAKWLGVQKIMEQIVALPLSMFVILVFGIAAWFFSYLARDYEEAQRKVAYLKERNESRDDRLQ
jgi:hypothetical protein